MIHKLDVIDDDLDQLNLMFVDQLNFLKHLEFVHLLVIVLEFQIIQMIKVHDLIEREEKKQEIFICYIKISNINHFLLQVLNFEYVLVLILIER